MTTTRSIAAAVLFAAAAAAHAGGPEYVDPAEGFQSTRSRADVIEELRQARADGMRVGSESYPGETEELARARMASEKQTDVAREEASRTIVAGH